MLKKFMDWIDKAVWLETLFAVCVIGVLDTAGWVWFNYITNSSKDIQVTLFAGALTTIIMAVFAKPIHKLIFGDKSIFG